MAALLLVLALVLPALPAAVSPAPVQAQIDNNSPTQPYGSVVDCIRTGADRSQAAHISPRFATTCFGSIWDQPNYETAGGGYDAPYTQPAVIEFGDGKPDTAGVEPGHSTRASLGTNGSTGGGTGLGAVYGLAHMSGTNPAAPAAMQTERLFTSAFTKRITRFGPGGPGAIYNLNLATNNEALFVQIPDVVPGPNGVAGDPGDGSPGAFPNGETAATYSPYTGGVHSYQHDDWGRVNTGRTGLGDLDLDPDERYLYVVNLRDKLIYQVDTWAASPQSTVTALPPFPNLWAGTACGVSANARPFGLHVTSTSVYLGVTCSAETTQARADLKARVWRYDIGTGVWDSTPALMFDLAAYDAQRATTRATQWQPWTDNATAGGTVGSFHLNPQPLLADIALDEAGNMLLGFRDRLADITGTGPAVEQGIPSGDILLAPANGSGGWNAPSTGAEHFNDYSTWPSDTQPEAANGALAYIPGTHSGAYGGEVVSAWLDPYRGTSFGAAWFDTGGGAPQAREELYYGVDLPYFGKAAGLGDIELLCAWAAVGDRVWADANGNGLQDGGESDISGVTLIARDQNGNELTQLTTGSVSGMSGNWRLYVRPFRSYSVQIAPAEFAAGGTLYGLGITTANAGNDALDSDADASGTITITPQVREAIDLSFDFGVAPGANVRISKSGTATVVVGDQIGYTLTWRNDGPSTARGVVVTDTLPPGVSLVGASPPPSAVSGQTLTWNLGDQAAGASGTISVVAQTSTATPASVTNQAAISTTSGGDSGGDNTTTWTTTVTRPNVRIVKTGPASAVTGDTVSYTLSYGNTGSAPAANVTVSDVLPAGLTFVSASPAPASVSGQTITWSLGTLTAGGTGSITVNAQLAASAPNAVTNPATISTTTPGDDPSDNTTTTTTNVLRPNVRVLKTGPATATVGDQITYTLSYANTGSAGAAGVQVTDVLPAGLTFVSASPAPTSVAGQVLTWSLGTLTAGATGSITVVAQTDPAAANGATVTNPAQISTTMPGDDPADNTTTTTTTLQRADVRITKSSPATFPVLSGQAVTYHLDFSNAGPAAALNVQLTDLVPAQLTGVSWSCASGCSGSGSGSTITVNLGTLAAGASGRVTVMGTAQTSLDREDFTNTARIATTTPETDTTNNESSIPGAVWTTDVQVIKLAQAQVTAGTTFTATLSYRNNGPAAADSVQLTDTLPAGVSLISSTPPVTSQSGQTLTWNLGTLADAQDGQIDLTLRADAALADGTTVTNQAAISTTDPDRNASNNTSQAQTLILAVADVQVDKTGLARVSAGDPVAFTLTYTNAGPSVARAAQLTDMLPAELTFSSATPAPTSVSGQTLTWDLGDLAPGASGTITVQAGTPFDLDLPSTPVTNQAAITTTTTDSDPANNQDEHTVDIETADLSVVKSAPAVAAAGAEFIYTLSYANAGPAPARGVTLRDLLPTGLTLVSSTPPPTGPGLRWSLGTLAAGASGTIVIRVRSAASTPDGTAYSNTAIIDTTTDRDRDPSNDSSTVTTTIRPNADLALVKSGPAGPIRSGSVISYTLAYTNAGPSLAASAILTDTLPPGFVLDHATPAATAQSGQALTWALGDLAPAASGVIMITGTLFGEGADATRVNTATLTSVTPDPDPTNNGSTVQTQLLKPDLMVAKTDFRTQVQPGETVTYTLTVTNTGLITATGVLLTETPPPGATVTGTTWTAAGGMWELAVGSLGPGDTLTRTITVELPNPLPAPQVINTVVVGDDGSAGTDPTPENNVATDEDTALCGSVGDLIWVDQDGDGQPDAGEPGLPFVKLDLLAPPAMTVLATTTTSSAGAYTFPCLRLGAYAVRIDPAALASAPLNEYAITTAPIPVTTLDPTHTDDPTLDIGLRPPTTTAVTLSYFVAQAAPGGVAVRWGTLSERNTATFQVVRATVNDPAQATPIGAAVASQGSRGGDYTVLDPSPPAGRAWYWLVETERSGRVLTYGPAVRDSITGFSQAIYLPLTQR